MHLNTLFFHTLVLSALPRLDAQNLQCASVADGCDMGTAHESGVRDAIARFENGKYYGGREQIVMSSALDGSALAMITYLCQDGSTPPRLEGSVIRSSFEKVLSCPNQCGGVSAPDNNNCGFGVLIANNAAGTNCFSKAINVVPNGSAPEIVTSVGDFKNPKCLFDAPGSRVLVNGSSVDHSSNGMTVEKCIGLAKDEAWRYAGVEFGGECYWGDDEVNPGESNQADCNTPCAGDPREVCGGGNRILVYENTGWVLLTRPDLADECQQYLGVLAQLKTDLEQWNNPISQYQAMLDAQSRKKRQETEIMRVFREIGETHDAIMKRKAQLEELEKLVRKVFEIANRKARVKPTEMELLVREIASPVTEVLKTVAAPAAIIPEVGASAATAAEVATAAIAVVGAPKVVTETGVIVATGIFALLGALIESLLDTTLPGETNLPPTPTPTITRTTSTTTTSSTCTATATQTPIIIVTKEGTSRSEFNDLVASLPKHADNQEYTSNSWKHWMYIATLDQCTSEALWDNPIVLGMSFDTPVEFEGYSSAPAKRTTQDRSEKKKKRSMRPQSESSENVKLRRTNDTPRSPNRLEAREVPAAGSRYKLQENSPPHLSWLTGLSRQSSTTGFYYDFENFMWDQQVGRLTGNSSPIIYIIDTFFNAFHPDIAGRVMATYRVGNSAILETDLIPPNRLTLNPNHGTCMATLAAGSYSGVAKDARLVLVQVNPDLDRLGDVASRAIRALLAVKSHVSTNSAGGRAVLSMSFGVFRNRVWWPNPLVTLRPGQTVDVFDIYLPELYEMGIVVVCSAGNDQESGLDRDQKYLTAKAPRSSGGRNTPLIVVGNANMDGSRYRTSQFEDGPTGNGILSLYNVGSNNPCGFYTGVWGIDPPGTSQATAVTAGMAAYYLADPQRRQKWANNIGDTSRKVKELLITTAQTNKGVISEGLDGVPRASLGELVPCDSAQSSGRPPSPPVTWNQVTDVVISDVTTDSEVVYRPLPQCYDLAFV